MASPQKGRYQPANGHQRPTLWTTPTSAQWLSFAQRGRITTQGISSCLVLCNYSKHLETGQWTRKHSQDIADHKIVKFLFKYSWSQEWTSRFPLYHPLPCPPCSRPPLIFQELVCLSLLTGVYFHFSGYSFFWFLVTPVAHLLPSIHLPLKKQACKQNSDPPCLSNGGRNFLLLRKVLSLE